MKAYRWFLLSTLMLLAAWSTASGQCREHVRTTGTCGFSATTSTHHSVAELMTVARRLYAEGRYHEAHAVLKVVQKLDPKNHAARACVVLCERRIGQPIGCGGHGSSEECEVRDECIQPSATAACGKTCQHSAGVTAACEVIEGCWGVVGGPCEIAIKCATAGIKSGKIVSQGCACPAGSQASSTCCSEACTQNSQCACGDKCACAKGQRAANCACGATCACVKATAVKKSCCCEQACPCAAKCACGDKCACGNGQRAANCACGADCACAKDAVKKQVLIGGKCPVLSAYKGQCPVLAGRMVHHAQPQQPTIVIIIQQAPAAPVPAVMPFPGAPVTMPMPFSAFIPAPLPPTPFVIQPPHQMVPPGMPSAMPPRSWVRQPQSFNMVVPTSNGFPVNVNEDRPGTILRPQD